MTDRILLITPPDDTLLQGLRILHVELTEDQNSIVSEALFKSDLPHSVINYVWKMGDSVEWLLDKISKCDLLFFNAQGPSDPGQDVIIGWVAAQPMSYYFGTLRDLHLANNNVIYNTNDILDLLDKINNKKSYTLNNLIK